MNPVEQMSADGKATRRIKPGRGQAITAGATSAQAARATDADTIIIRVVATAAAWLHIDTATAVAAAANVDIYLPAGVPEYLIVPPGAFLSAIQATAAGLVYIAEV